MKQLIICAFLFLANSVFAQTEAPVHWDIVAVKDDNNVANTIQLNVSLEHGWHIFAYDAGGDGLAINTTVVLQSFDKKNKKIGEVNVTDSFATEKPVNVNMEGFGIVHYFDKEFSYFVPIANNVHRVQAKITYQACNSNMCLPPVDKILNLQLIENKK
jgi:Disulphide bond corrector protein DsbC